MNIKYFNRKNNGGDKNTNPIIKVLKQGFIILSKEAAEVIGLKDSSHVEFAQSADNPKDWYIFESIGYDAFSLHRQSDGLRIKLATKVNRAIKESLGIANESVVFLISQEPEIHDNTSLFPIITKTPLKIIGNKNKS